MPDSAQYWIDRNPGADDVLLSGAEIDALNRQALVSDPHLVDLHQVPDQLPGEELRHLILKAGKIPPNPLHYEDGQPLTATDYDRYRSRMALDQIGTVVEPRFALVTQRSDMRSWPTPRPVFSKVGNPTLDRFQENGLFPADKVAVLHNSSDDAWCFVQSYNYAAWTPRKNLALGDRSEVLAYGTGPHFRVVTGKQAMARINGSTLRLEMGVRVPAGDDGSTVILPIRKDSGELAWVTATFDEGAPVSDRYLPFTRANVLRQAFRFLGEHYGWGHSLDARDCSGLVLEVFKSMGIMLPRNSTHQGHGNFGRSVRFAADATVDEKITALESAQAGDLIYSKGHVMIYLGTLEGAPYVIHDTAGAGQLDEHGQFDGEQFTGVSVSPLLALRHSPDTTYLEEIYAIKHIK